MKLKLLNEIVSDMGQYITTREAAKILGVSDARVRQFIGDGRLKAHHPKAGRRDNFLLRADVEAFDKKEREITGRPDEGKGFAKKDD
jgi:DNA binding domain, excisionase family